MQAAVFKEQGVLVVEEVPEPAIGPRDVLLKTSHCAICGSDLHRYQHGMLRPGAILGHEYAGTVVDRGVEVRGFEIGARVTRSGGPFVPGRDVSPYPPRFSARKRGFLATTRPGAYAEFMAVDADLVMRIPESVTNLEAALTEPLAVSLHAVRLSRCRPGDRVLVIGAGPIGLLAQQCASLAGACRVFVSETNAARRAAASQLGADVVVDPTRTDPVEEILRHTQYGVEVAFECAGAQPTLDQALNCVRASGQVVVVSLSWEPVYCLPVEWVAREVEMKTAYGCLPSEWPMAMDLLERRKLDVRPLTGTLVPLQDIQSAFQELLRPNTSWIQAIVTFD